MNFGQRCVPERDRFARDAGRGDEAAVPAGMHVETLLFQCRHVGKPNGPLHRRHAEQETTEESTQDIADKAVSSYTREFLYSLNDAERSTVQQIDQALARIEDGTFGLCLNCGTPMNEKRLSAIPWSRHCVECQELAEKGLLEA